MITELENEFQGGRSLPKAELINKLDEIRKHINKFSKKTRGMLRKKINPTSR